MMYVDYTSNNSGGDWWLSDRDWYRLEEAGWEVDWRRNDPDFPGGRWLGALATSATRRGLTLEAAIAEFERITSEKADERGCECCGQPHSFYLIEKAV